MTPPFTNICPFKECCPSASGWCFNQQPSKKCIKFLKTHLDIVNQDLVNTEELIQIIKERDTT